jgi:hypothetical protein
VLIDALKSLTFLLSIEKITKKILLQYFGYESFWLQILQIHRNKTRQSS